MNIDKLTSEERMRALVLGEKLDRVPVIPHMEAFAGKICNMSTEEFYLNPTSSYDAQIWCEELFGYDGGVGYGIPQGYTVDFGGEIEFPKTANKLSLPKILKKAVNSMEDVEKLELPDIEKAFFSSRILEFNKICIEKGEEASFSAGSPMNIVQCICGAELLMRWILKAPELVHSMLRISTDYIIEMGKKHIEYFGADKVSAGISCPMESHALMSPKAFEKFSLPYLIEIFETFDEMGIHIGSVHLCGDHRKNLDHWKNDIKLKDRTLITAGTEMDLEFLGKEFGDRYIIGGNLKNTTLQLGRPEDVYKEAEEIIKKMKYFKGGFVLTPDCTLSYLTPSANLYAMIKATRDFGAYN